MREDDDTAGRVTLAEVATQAGVSLSTVSKVLNGRSDVSPPTRAKVDHPFTRGSPRSVPRPAWWSTAQGCRWLSV
ncbi:LacI family DNA-binding transcriptional regulator [Streptomyces minutiscleroticus]|uniref:LacI family DNA-binding transcriptional regulator n=1 Tax=Streptomyces minutiscleroticus TaxID=68238 RepID=UPI003D9EDD22